MTATQKIIATHVGSAVHAGQLVLANVDLLLANDVTAPVAIEEFEKLGKSLYNPDSIVFVLDHFTPNKDIKSAELCKKVREFANKHNIAKFYDCGRAGIEHVLLPEEGLVKPASLIIGADSHTCTYGALSCFSSGVGSTDIAVAMATNKVWFKVPSAIKINIKNKLPKYVSGKDVILTIIKILGVDGATYKSLEFFGDIDSLSIDDRFTIANMAVECGAKNAFFPLDNVAKEYLKDKFEYVNRDICADSDANYDDEITIDLSTLSPVVARPHLPSNVVNADTLQDVKLDQVVIGSCTNGRLSDLKVTAEILQNHKVNKNTRLIIIPATQHIYLEALRLGYIETFINAGAVVSTPTCGCCLGGHMGVIGENEVALSSTNRNFVGRMGHKNSYVYLASPAVCATSAIAGYIKSPKE